jgi:Ni,Fe-hydrogenase I cytochrome b subunit
VGPYTKNLAITGYFIGSPLPSMSGEASDFYVMGYIRFFKDNDCTNNKCHTQHQHYYNMVRTAELMLNTFNNTHHLKKHLFDYGTGLMQVQLLFWQ